MTTRVMAPHKKLFQRPLRCAREANKSYGLVCVFRHLIDQYPKVFWQLTLKRSDNLLPLGPLGTKYPPYSFFDLSKSRPAARALSQNSGVFNLALRVCFA